MAIISALMEKGGEVGMRLIDADALAGKIMMEAPDFMDGGSTITKAFILAMVKTRSVTPTVDAVPVVRCKDCRRYYANGGACEQVLSDWFCADGERKKGL